MTLGSKFNDTVCLDLKEHGHNQFWILHLIDTSTRYSAVWLIKTQKSEEIICNMFLMWISYFGASKWFSSDNVEGYLIMKATDRWMKDCYIWRVLSVMCFAYKSLGSFGSFYIIPTFPSRTFQRLSVSDTPSILC